ncbi:MAG: dihydropteroate synthase, partial [Myxococcales bacterium]|nr:dihydropteroate synthase [Myxococcales bacterium]
MRLGPRSLKSHGTLLVGIVNTTDDSFSADGTGDDAARAIAQGQAMVAAGADMLDIGGESTRPGARTIPADQEARRVVPVIEALTRLCDVPLSVDTQKASVADQALAAGAVMINDVSGFGDPDMARVARKYGAAWVLMHMPHATGEMGWSQAAGPMSKETRAGCAQVVSA